MHLLEPLGSILEGLIRGVLITGEFQGEHRCHCQYLEGNWPVWRSIAYQSLKHMTVRIMTSLKRSLFVIPIQSTLKLQNRLNPISCNGKIHRMFVRSISSFKSSGALKPEIHFEDRLSARINGPFRSFLSTRGAYSRSLLRISAKRLITRKPDSWLTVAMSFK